MKNFVFCHRTYTKDSTSRIVDAIKFLPPNFANFATLDLERLKDEDKWLSDSHVTLGIQFVYFSYHFGLHLI